MRVFWFLLLGCLLLAGCGGKSGEPGGDSPPAKDNAASGQSGADQLASSTEKSGRKSRPATPVIPADQQDKSGSDESDQPAKQDPAGESASDNPAEDVIAEYTGQMNEFMTRIRAAKTNEERRALMGEQPRPAEYFDRLTGLAEQNPGTPIALSAWVWLSAAARSNPELQDRAYDELVENFSDRPELAGVALNLVNAKPSPATTDRLQSMIRNSPHDEVRAAATFALAGYLAQVDEYSQREMNPRMKQFFGEDSVAYLESHEPDPARIEGLYENLVDNYANVRLDRNGRPMDLAKMAESALFEIRNLSINCVAPDITGDDLDGVEFNLSDYRGKVVVLDFWGHW